jgi:hypothetical protein
MTSIAEVAQALREAAVVQVSIVSAFKPGDVIVLECDKWLSEDHKARLRSTIEAILESTEIKIILLERGMHVAARERLEFKSSDRS